MNACSPPVTNPRNIIGSGTANGMIVNRIRMTSSSPKMLPKSRSESYITRAAWLIISMGKYRKPIIQCVPGGAQKCFTYPTIPCSLIPWKW